MVDTGDPMARNLLAARKLKKTYRSIIQRDPCAYCGWSIETGEHRKIAQGTIDHIVPKSTVAHHYKRSPKEHEERGWENWTGSCYNCNHAKKDIDLLSFLLLKNRPRTTVSRMTRKERRSGIQTRLNLLH